MLFFLKVRRFSNGLLSTRTTLRFYLLSKELLYRKGVKKKKEGYLFTYKCLLVVDLHQIKAVSSNMRRT